MNTFSMIRIILNIKIQRDLWNIIYQTMDEELGNCDGQAKFCSDECSLISTSESQSSLLSDE